MSFFNPWLWFGLVALGAPLWLHLQRRADRDAFVFPALQFLDDAPVARRAPLSLRDLLLFLLRITAVTLLVALFAWPYLRTEGPAVVSASRVYILDNTLSQQANDGFVHDRDAVLRELAKLPESTQAAVIELRGKPQTVVNFSDNSEDARAKLKALTPSSERGNYLSAFRQANTLLERALGTQREIVFFGDQQTNQWSENENAPPFLRNVQVTLAHPATELVRDNAAVSSPAVDRVFLGSRSVIRGKCVMQHSGHPGNATIVIEANQREIYRRSLNIDEQPENALLGVEWESPAADWIEGVMRLEHAPDALPPDDRAYFAAPPMLEGKIALLSRSPYLRTALSPQVARGHWSLVEINSARLDELAKTSPNDDADLLVLDASFLQSAAVRSAVDRYLRSGRGVFVCVDRLTPIVTEALRQLGISASERPSSGAPDRIGKFLLSHPALATFASPDFGNILAVQFEEHPHIDALSGTPLLFSTSGEALLVEGTQGSGRWMVSAFPFDRTVTNWVIEPTFIPFLDLAFQHLRRESTLVAALEPGQLWQLELAPGENARKVILRDRDKKVAEAEVGADRTARLHAPQRPGTYRLSFDDKPDTRRIAVVNLRPEESVLTYLKGEPPSLAAWKYPSESKGQEHASSAAVPGNGRRAELQQRYWWYLALATMGSLALEGILLQISKARRRMATQPS
jgi:hypothetical protein